MEDSNQTTIDRFYNQLYAQLYAMLPKPSGNLHPYSTGNLISKFRVVKTSDGYELIISEGVDYARYAMGYNDSGGKRNARGPHEAYNFKIIETCIRNVSKNAALGSGGKVEILL